MTRSTYAPDADVNGVWSPDGRRLAFASVTNSGIFSVFVKETSGTGTEDALLNLPLSTFLDDWSADGGFLLYQTGDLKAGRDLWAVSLDGGQRPISIAATQFDEKEGQFSADGRWVAYESSASGRF